MTLATFAQPAVQRDRLLAALLEGPVTKQQAYLLRIVDVPSRVAELQAEGHCIELRSMRSIIPGMYDVPAWVLVQADEMEGEQ